MELKENKWSYIFISIAAGIAMFEMLKSVATALLHSGAAYLYGLLIVFLVSTFIEKLFKWILTTRDVKIEFSYMSVADIDTLRYVVAIISDATLCISLFLAPELVDAWFLALPLYLVGYSFIFIKCLKLPQGLVNFPVTYRHAFEIQKEDAELYRKRNVQRGFVGSGFTIAGYSCFVCEDCGVSCRTYNELSYKYRKCGCHLRAREPVVRTMDLSDLLKFLSHL